MRDWHCEPLLRLTNYSIPPRLMASMLEAGDCMAVSAAAYGVGELKRGIELIVSDPIFTLTGLYALNPLNTATLDPRARLLGLTTYSIPSRSMAPTLDASNYIAVST